MAGAAAGAVKPAAHGVSRPPFFRRPFAKQKGRLKNIRAPSLHSTPLQH
ncbi:hypothetical protein HMPREF9123_1530 [Neisseria bacilliformis ATCC BAA-1200]|uniref:Uncharacterized protein n=1 Tax=Neisseria bacilliformis ATCC BAA-1200 TaxID=888742 RepID=F2BCS5_9NEIS|nr:hypothetical protein HMPREF9123_1530 [Neisseria bacilliformis ATCC BAA-1200]